MRTTMKMLFFMMFLLILPSCGSSENDPSVAQSIQYKVLAISAEEYTYSEKIVLSGSTMTIIRNGGDNVNVGTWTISLDSDEVSAINDLVHNISVNAADDIVVPIIFDAPTSELTMNGKTYVQGYVTVGSVTEYHDFSSYVRSLTQYLDRLVTEYANEPYK